VKLGRDEFNSHNRDHVVLKHPHRLDADSAIEQGHHFQQNLVARHKPEVLPDDICPSARGFPVMVVILVQNSIKSGGIQKNVFIHKSPPDTRRGSSRRHAFNAVDPLCVDFHRDSQLEFKQCRQVSSLCKSGAIEPIDSPYQESINTTAWKELSAHPFSRKPVFKFA
jgi:hypothetical protein